MTAPARRRGAFRAYALIAVAALVALALLAPNAIAAQIGGFIGSLWVSVMGWLMALLGAG